MVERKKSNRALPDASAAASDQSGGNETKNFEEEVRTLEVLNRVGATVAAEPDLERAVHPGVRDVTASVLRERNYEVQEAGCGEDDLVLLDQRLAVNLIMLDFAMPGMNGVDLARLVRARHPGIPLLFALAMRMRRLLPDSMKIKSSEKPFDDAELEARVRRLIAGREGRSTIAKPDRPERRQAGRTHFRERTWRRIGLRGVF